MDFMVKNLEIPSCLVILQPGMARFGDQRTAYIADQSMRRMTVRLFGRGRIKHGCASTVDRYLLHGNRNLCRVIVGGRRPGGNAGGVSSGRRFAETSDISSPTHGSVVQMLLIQPRFGFCIQCRYSSSFII
ncbi:unnamed protein product, partial [Musa textilis]